MGCECGKPLKLGQLQKEADPEAALFECNEAGCSQSFDSYDAFQDHVNFGHYTPVSKSQESTYDKLHREWVLKFSSMTVNQEALHQPSASSDVTTASEPRKSGWALQKPIGSGTLFSERVKQYLQSCFYIGVRTGRKADPAQVSVDMRNDKIADGQRAFSREEWLTKVQIKGFFSRLAAAQRTTGARDPLYRRAYDCKFKDGIPEEGWFSRDDKMNRLGTIQRRPYHLEYTAWFKCRWCRDQPYNIFSLLLMVVKSLCNNTELSTAQLLSLYSGEKRKHLDISFLGTKNETRSIEDIPSAELNLYLSEFIIKVCTKQNKDYEPNSLCSMVASFKRCLKKKNYGLNIMKDLQFQETRKALLSKQKDLKQQEKGNKPNALSALSEDDIAVLYEKELLGTSSPDALLNTLWFNNTIHFGLPGCKEHRNMTWGDVKLHKTVCGEEYLEYSERQTKTCSGQDTRDVQKVTPRMFSLPGNERDPIAVYKVFAEKHPAEMDSDNSPFFLAVNNLKKPESVSCKAQKSPSQG
ncbi:zinc finger MYM-type 2-like [Paramuricea clavata]|uniref:Zinc finger MYM-type 2-like n=1 Tax=Paramuricea clavata TaxID=317549 RepID=A0A6S7IVQ5_PARCT|nr:zinc finger MYM-type 2-like [Paramuricea clavata]